MIFQKILEVSFDTVTGNFFTSQVKNFAHENLGNLFNE